MTIPYSRQFIHPSDIAAVHDALLSDTLTGGPGVLRFEEQIKAITGARYAIACSNGTAALHLICLGLGITPAEKGITSPISFVASSNCFEFCGAQSDFVDIDPATLCISPDRLREYCTQHTPPRVVVAVSFAGIPAPLNELRNLSREFGFWLIEDAAHSIGSTYRVDSTWHASASCAHSDAAILSFHPVKTITTAEGGAITTNDEKLATRIRQLRSHGIERDQQKLSLQDGPWCYEMGSLGFNYRIPDLLCALGSSQLSYLDESKQRRQELVASYNHAFGDDPRLIIPSLPEDLSPCFHLYPIQFVEGASRRRALYDFLLSRGIQTQVHYIPIYWQPYYSSKYGFAKGKCPAAEQYYSRCLSLPLFYGLTNEEQHSVIETVREGLNHAR